MKLANVDLPVVRCPTCNVPYLLRYAIHLGGDPPEYIFQKDCKHKVATQQVDIDTTEWALFNVARLKEE